MFLKVFFFPLLLFVLFISSIFAQSNTPTPQNTPNLSNTVSLSEYREILDSERKLLDEQSEKYYSRVDTLINRTLSVLGVIGAVALGLFVWQFGKTRKELKDTVHEQFQSQVSSLVDSEMNELRSAVKILKSQVQELQVSQNQSIVWVFSNTEMNAQSELDVLHSKGLENIQIITPEKAEDLELGEPDLVIFSFDGTDEARNRLEKIVCILKEKSPPVSLLIYTYNQDGTEIRLQTKDFHIMKGFHWFLPVNVPTSLVSQTQLLVRTKRDF